MKIETSSLYSYSWYLSYLSSTISKYDLKVYYRILKSIISIIIKWKNKGVTSCIRIDFNV